MTTLDFYILVFCTLSISLFVFFFKKKSVFICGNMNVLSVLLLMKILCFTEKNVIRCIKEDLGYLTMI